MANCSLPARVASARLLVLGYGNPGRQDDGLGPAAAEEIERLQFPGIRTSANYQLMIEDASDAAEADAVVFIDAAKVGTEPYSVGTVYPAADVSCFASHVVAPGLVLALCERLYGHRPHASLVGIRGYDFRFGEGLTERAQENLQLALAYIYSSFAKVG